MKPLPYTDPGSLVKLYEKRPAEGMFTNSVSPADYLDWARLNQSFISMAAFADTGVDLTGNGEPERLRGAVVTAAFFDVFGVRPIHGRTFQAGEDKPGRNRVVVITHSLWRQRFGADPAVVGRRIVLSDIPHEVIGVLPHDVEFPKAGAGIFLPLVLHPGTEPPSRGAHFLDVYGRLKRGVPMERPAPRWIRSGAISKRSTSTRAKGTDRT